MMNPRELCGLAPVIPVLVVDDVAAAIPLAEALVAGGLPVLEVTLRTENAIEVMRAMKTVPGAIVGAGTVMSRGQAEAVVAAGGEFAVSPGCTDELATACRDNNLPLLPGAVTPSEVMKLMAQGFDALKFFPAEAAGGAAVLKAWQSPLSGVVFCATGGIGMHNAPDYLGLSNVPCIGGSWVADKKLIAVGDWAGIESLAKEAAGLKAV